MKPMNLGPVAGLRPHLEIKARNPYAAHWAGFGPMHIPDHLMLENISRWHYESIIFAILRQFGE